MYKSSICARHSLIWCKFLHRTYYTKAWLAKICNTGFAACDRFQLSPANLILMFWLSPQLQSYWTMAFVILSDTVCVKIDSNPLSALFGVSPSLSPLNAAQKDVLAFTTLLARRVILTKWKAHKPPSYTHWLRDVLHFLKLDKLRMSLRGSSDKFMIVWDPFFQTVQNINFPCP